ncbi:MAG: DUF4367 domain-containing protein [Roseburia sp.]|nr:DUF4367 domain-containing protein [Roseburia sp.]MCM1278396.1 DUF4367 domain-containing protein [Robinsoniella sp.]
MQDKLMMQYKDINEKIQVPSRLKEDTIRLMKENKSVKNYRAFAYAAAVFAGIAVLGIALLQLQQGTKKELTICDALDENQVKEQVELSEGSLYFQGTVEEFTAPGLSLGILDGEKIPVGEKEYFDYLGKNPLPSYVPEGMEKKEAENYGEDLFSVKYEGSNESFLEILLSAKGIPKADAAEALIGSLVDGIEIKTAFYETKSQGTVFLAYFQTDGVGYQIKSRGISQEEFIRVLLSILEK